MAMEVQGSRRPQQDGGGVKVKFIETQFVSSDAASFKAVVQRLTGKSPAAASSQKAHQAARPQPQRPRPCRPAFAAAGQQQATGGWTTTADQQQAAAGGYYMAPKQEPFAAAAPRLQDMDELCDFADLFYTTAASARRDGGASAFPY